MRLILFLVVGIPLMAQAPKVAQLEPGEVTALRVAREHLQAARAEWDTAINAAMRRHAMAPAVATAGDVSVAVVSTLSGWEFGADPTEDLAFLVARRPPVTLPAACPAREEMPASSHEVDTIPSTPYLR